MFSLIITIISIALVAALALATLYFGGSAFSQGGDAAAAAKLMNEGAQLRGALTLYKSDTGAEASSQADLTAGNYLKAPISDWQFTDGAAYNSTVTAAICSAANAKAGFSTTPACSDNSTAPCCELTTP